MKNSPTNQNVGIKTVGTGPDNTNIGRYKPKLVATVKVST